VADLVSPSAPRFVVPATG